MSPIAAIGAALTPPLPPAVLGTPAASAPGGGESFGKAIGDALAGAQQVQSKADSLAVSAATGDLADPQDYLIAATEASLSTQLTVAVRNKAVEAFSEIMRLQA